jgi:hypothetical protein
MKAFAHPLVESYLSELETLLAGVPPAERAETLAGVREHMAASLAHGSSDEDVRRVLGEMGSPQTVADEAYVGVRSAAATQPRRRGAAMGRSWVPVLVSVLQGLALLAFVAILLTAPGSSETVAQSVDAAGHSTTSHVDDLDPSTLFLLASGLLITLPFWLPTVVLVSVATTWRKKERLTMILLVPGLIVLTAALIRIGGSVGGVTGQTVAAWLALVSLLLGGGGTIVLLTRRALGRCTE